MQPEVPHRVLKLRRQPHYMNWLNYLFSNCWLMLYISQSKNRYQMIIRFQFNRFNRDKTHRNTKIWRCQMNLRPIDLWTFDYAIKLKVANRINEFRKVIIKIWKTYFVVQVLSEANITITGIVTVIIFYRILWPEARTSRTHVSHLQFFYSA